MANLSSGKARAPLEARAGTTAAWRAPPPALVAAALVIAVALAYGQTGAFPFSSLDDPLYVAENPRVRAGLSWSSVAWAFTTFDAANWHPLTWLSYLLDATLFGPTPGPMHLVNVALHAANAVLLLVALRRLTGAPWRSALVAALFAAHPMHVESVAWVAERKDVLSVLFGLLALLAYERYARRPGIGRYLAVAAAFAGSLMAKAMLCTLPFLLLLLDVWPLRRLAVGRGAPTAQRVGWGRAVLEKVPLLALSAADAALTLLAQRSGGAFAADPSNHRFANALTSYARYGGLLLWPADLSAFYPMAHDGLPAAVVLGAVAVLVLATAGAVLLFRHEPAVAIGWAWFLGTLVPVIGLVQVGSQALADRYTYFPSIGFSIALVWGLASLPWPGARRIVAALGALAVAALLLLTHRQAALWSDDALLFEHALRVTSPNTRVEHMLANVLVQRGREAEALGHLLASVRIFPNETNLTALGRLYLRLGAPAKAEAAFRLAQEIEPTCEEAALRRSRILADAGRADEAVEALLPAARNPRPVPFDAASRAGIGAALVDLGRIEEGVAVLEAAVAHAPTNPELLSSLSEAYFHAGDRSRAARTASEALTRGARSGGAYLVLAASRVADGEPGEAVELLRRAIGLEPEEPLRRLALADALQALGRREAACAEWRFVLGSTRALASDQERARRGATAAGCP